MLEFFDVKQFATPYATQEEALETIKAEDLWAENTDSVAEYRTASTYLVRAVTDSNDSTSRHVLRSTKYTRSSNPSRKCPASPGR